MRASLKPIAERWKVWRIECAAYWPTLKTSFKKLTFAGAPPTVR